MNESTPRFSPPSHKGTKHHQAWMSNPTLCCPCVLVAISAVSAVRYASLLSAPAANASGRPGRAYRSNPNPSEIVANRIADEKK